MPLGVGGDFYLGFCSSGDVLVDGIHYKFFGEDGFGFEPIELVGAFEIDVLFGLSCEDQEYFDNLGVLDGPSLQ